MFVNIHSHSDYSLLDGAGTAEIRATVAKELGQDALSLTDHGTMSGIPAHIKACNNVGIKPIIGIEAYFTPDSTIRGTEVRKSHHVILLAKNQTGFKNLIKLSTKAYSDGFYGKPRVDYKMMEEYSEGVMCSTACIGSYLSFLIQQNDHVKVNEMVERHLQIFGEDNFRFEIMPHDIPAQRLVNQTISSLSLDYNIPVIATIDSHFPYRDWAGTAEVITMIAQNQTMKDRRAKREKGEDVYGATEDSDTLHLMHEKEVYEKFAQYHPDLTTHFVDMSINETYDWTSQIEKIDLDYSDKMPKIHKYEKSAEQIVRDRCLDGLKRIGKQDDETYIERMNFELETMKNLEVFDYMVLVSDLVQKSRDAGIRISSGRGSAAGSLVSYLIGIITIDPIGHGLLFERFLNPDRKGLPDIDLDFQDNRRDEVKQFLSDDYGEDHVANIGAFGTYMPKGVIKDVSKIYGVPFDKVNNLTKLIPDPPNQPDLETVAKMPEIKEFLEDNPEILIHARRMDGQVKNLSQHAAGVVICEQPITDYMPMVRAKEEKNLVSAWSDKADFPIISELGFLKIDVLSIDGLTKQAIALQTIEEETGEKINLDDLEVAIDPSKVDQKVMDVFRKGLTVGIWQFSSTGITNFMKKVKPDRFEDLVAVNALYRPGPLDGGDAELYAKRKNGEEPIVYWHPLVEPHLEETYGIMCYQEQMMGILQDLGGFTPGEADFFRKACSKLYRVSSSAAREAMSEYKPKWDEGCASKGMTLEESDYIWDRILAFGSYSFNKSHSASYALLAYQDAYLKTYYGKHFYSALLTTSSSKNSKRKQIEKIVREAKMMQLKIMNPHINKSGKGFTIVDDGILYGLEAVKYVGETAIEEIMKARPVLSINDLTDKAPKNKVNKRVVEHLIKSGAMDEFGSREDYSEDQKRRAEEDSLGFALTGTGNASKYANILDERITTSVDFDDLEVGKMVVVGGEITAMKEIQTAKGDPMAFLEVIYNENIWSITVFKENFWRYNNMLKEGSLVIIRGVKDGYNEKNIIMKEMASLEALSKELELSPA